MITQVDRDAFYLLLLAQTSMGDLDVPQLFEMFQRVPPFDLFGDPLVAASFFYFPPILSTD
jgi:hypothetical protein